MAEHTVNPHVRNVNFPATRLCPNYPGYSVSDDGRVFSHKRRLYGGKRGCRIIIDREPQRELKPQLDKYGYVWVPTKGCQKRKGRAHQMVLAAFVGPRPSGMEIRHLDGNKLNNHVSNLVYGTCKQNAEDRLRHGTSMHGERHYDHRLTTAQVREIRRRHGAGENRFQLSKEFGVCWSSIDAIVTRRHWKHVA